ncbi:MAG: META domain-containing protein [Alcanivoracaceae bacterium]|nr:META domain-containing protein [Alcanivoracaceae bacterium]
MLQRAPFILLTAVSLFCLSACGDDSSNSKNTDDNAGTAASEQSETTSRIGQYVYYADAAMFTECETGKRWPVAPSEKALKLERSYLEGGRKTLEPMIVSVDTHIDLLDGMEPGTKQAHLVIDKFNGVKESFDCNLPRASLTNTYWKLISVSDLSDIAPDARGEPHLILTEDNKVKGHGGCNDFNGRYTHQFDTLKFKNISATRMACASIGALEAAMFAALDNTRSYRIDGEKLFLETEAGTGLAVFESVYF